MHIIILTHFCVQVIQYFGNGHLGIEGSYINIHFISQVTNQNVQDADCVKLIQTVFKEVHVQVNLTKTEMYSIKGKH